MAALLTNTFESSAADGSTITVANSANPDPFYADAITTAATVQYSTAQAQKGTKSMRLVYSNVAGQAGVQLNQPVQQPSAAVRFYLRWASLPSTSGMCVFALTSPALTSRRAFMTVNNNGYPAIYDNVGGWIGKGGTGSFTGSGAFTLNTWYRVEFGITTGQGDGSSDLRIYLGDETTEIANMSWIATAQQYGTTSGGICNFMIGRFNADNPVANGTPTLYYDDVAWNLGSPNLLGPSTVAPASSGDVHVHIG